MKIEFGPRLLIKFQRLGAGAGCILGMILAVGSVAGSFFVPTKTLGVLVASAGCFLSGCIFTVFFAKSMKLAEAAQAKNENLQRDLDAKIKEVAQLKSKAERLQIENDRLNHQRIDINSVGPILKIGLAEVDMTIKDFKRDWYNDLDNRWLRTQRSQYLVLLEKSFKATFGIDMKKLEFKEDSDCIRVYGFETENIGFRDLEDRWLLCQKQTFALKKQHVNDQSVHKKASAKKAIQSPNSKSPTQSVKSSGSSDNPGESFVENGFKYTIDRTEIAKASLDLNQLETYSKSQSEELTARINQLVGPEFNIVNEHIRDMTENLLTMLLKPLGKKLVFINAKPEGKGLRLDEFVKECNKKLLN